MPEASSSPERRVIVLGSTGSIGTQTLAVIEHLNALHRRGESSCAFRVVGLAAGSNGALLAEQAKAWPDATLALTAPNGIAAKYTGPDAAERLVRETPCDLIVAAIVGSAGIAPTFAAIELGRTIALANKETLVAAGDLAVRACAASGATLLPVDSEHSGVWQVLGTQASPPFKVPRAVERITLTASGGPFRTLPLDELRNVTVERALRHPTWSMGPKVTIDSASLMNKALEIIEAHWLFGVPRDRLAAVIHPQSVVHAFVEFADGSTVAQLGAPDMRTPIQLALTSPTRAHGCSKRLDLFALKSLEFQPVDPARYPAFGLADRALQAGGTAGAVLNAANECAVAAYLDARCRFTDIPAAVARAMDEVGASPIRTLADVRDAEAHARRSVRSTLNLQTPAHA